MLDHCLAKIVDFKEILSDAKNESTYLSQSHKNGKSSKYSASERRNPSNLAHFRSKPHQARSHTNHNLSISATELHDKGRLFGSQKPHIENEFRSLNYSMSLNERYEHLQRDEAEDYSDFESIENLYLSSETFSLINSMLQNIHYRQIALSKLRDQMSLSILTRFIEKLSRMKVLAIPHAFEFIKHTQLNNSELREANDALTNGMCDEVDVIALSYQREIVFSILNIIKLLFDIKDQAQHEGKYEEKLPLIDELLSKNLSDVAKKFTLSLQDAVIKWVDFEDEPQVSCQIFDIIIKLDSLKQETSDSCGKNLSSNQEIYELSLQVLPFFCHLQRSGINSVEVLQERIYEMHNTLENDLQNSTKLSEDLSRFHIQELRNLVLILIKANGLFQSRPDSDQQSVNAFYSFVLTSYQYLIFASCESEIAKSLWGFNRYFFTIHWKNKECNGLHIELLMKVLQMNGLDKMDIDS